MNNFNNGNMPANPLTGDAYIDFAYMVNNGGASYNPECQGLTKREHFAALAMQGLLAQSNGSAISSDCTIGAKYCVDMADALLKALEGE